MRNILKISLLVFLVASCSQNKSFDSEEEFLGYIKNPDNGFTQTKTVNGVKISLTYRPSALMAVLEAEGKTLSVIKQDSLKKKYDRFAYFLLTYTKNDNELLSTVPTSREEFNELQNTLTFRMNEMASLTTEKKDTVPLLDFNSPRTYGMSRSTNILFVFERNKIMNESEDLQFNLKDIGLGTGDLKFNFSHKLLTQNFNY